MLPQRWRTAAHHLIPSRITPAISAVCRCRCGATFQPSGRLGGAQQTRSAGRKSPATRDRENRQRGYTLTPEEAKNRKRAVQEDQQWFYVTCQDLRARGFIEVTADTATDFMTNFDDLIKKVRGRPAADPNDFKSLQTYYEISDTDCFRLSRVLLYRSDQDLRFRGRKLLFTLSRAGYEEATIFIVGNAVLKEKRRPGSLKKAEIAHPRGHLAEMARLGLSYRAMVLEAKVALALGQEMHAIDLLTRAMSAAVDAANERELMRSRGQAKEIQADNDEFELSTPWADVMLIHYDRWWNRRKDECEQFEWAMKIGCEQDDPICHRYAAQHIDQNTSDWLYHITKAAGSGDWIACHQLGEFYATAPWKYIEDEPPDHVKPTPFDSYPAPPVQTSKWERFRQLIGLSPLDKADPKDALFRSAVFPHTTMERRRLAFGWLGVAVQYSYVPSLILRARMAMQETIWHDLQAPKSALELRNDRYDFASEEAKTIFESEQAQVDDEHSQEEESPDEEVREIPNRFHLPDRAKQDLREVFFAYQAHSAVQKQRADWQSARRRGWADAVADDEEIIGHENMDHLPPAIRKFCWNTEVRESYEDDMEKLRGQAKELCDKQGWDLYDEEGGLLYKANKARATRSPA